MITVVAARPAARDAALPGLDVPRVPRPAPALAERVADELRPMPALDRRLVRRTRSVRPLLALDAALGVATVVPVVATAVLLGADRRRRGRRRRRSRRCAPTLVLLALAFAARGALGWAMEVAGRRAAADVLSELRLELVERRLDAAADRRRRDARPARSRPPAVNGVDALEGYFARYLPQLVLAAIVPLAVVAWVATIDLAVGAADDAHAPARAGVHVADRPRDRAAHAASAGSALRRPVDALPRRGARAADAARVQPGGGRGRAARARSATATGARRWARCASASSPAPCSSSRRRSGSRSWRSPSACGSSAARSGSRRA